MFSHLLISFIVVIGGLIFGYKYVLSKYSKAHPNADATTVTAVIGLTMLQFGIWALAFIPLWAFMPTHPEKDGGMAFWNSDLVNWEIFREVANYADGLYLMQTVLGVCFIIFGGISASIIYSLIKEKIYSDSTIKTLSLVVSIFSGLLAWNILSLTSTLLFLSIFGKLLLKVGEGFTITLIIIVNIIILVWLIKAVIKTQKKFNKFLPEFMNDNPKRTLSNNISLATGERTKKCPYCGETIIAVAKKCKHCGEWIKDEDVVAEVNETPISAPRNAFREKVAAERTITSNNKGGHNKSWLWWLIGIAVVATTCIIILSNKSDSDDEPFDPAWYQEPQESEPSESDFIID